MWNRNFILLLCSQLFSVFGNTIIQFSISLYVLDKTGSSTVFALISALSIISRVICLPFGGVLSDRVSKKKLMIIMDFIYLLLSIGLVLSVFSDNTVFIMGAITVVIGMVSSFETPVVQSAIPIVCKKEDISQANGIITSVAMLSNILGPIIAGIVYRFDQAYMVFIICGFLFAVAVISEILLKLPNNSRWNSTSSILSVVYEDLREVVEYLKGKKVILRISLIAFLLNLFISSFISVIIPYTVRVSWNISSELFGVMNMLFAIGGLMGSAFVGIYAKKINSKITTKLLILNSFLFMALAFPYSELFNVNMSFWILTILATVLQGVFTLVSVQLISFIQMSTDIDMLGRVMSFVMMASMLAMPIGQFIFGIFGEILVGKSMIVVILITGFISILISIYSKNTFNKIEI
ncbi:Predicted arabinose efflux permease, MFS family [Anaerosphaera aminiphila DSM 21120]|uniref:Predicted arabinose efflux permease, MFS family n=1 Tax=Anaerosphaera aminiphila DSM 21120 TaxID=1120995 RepID=A0A1M5PFA3_9FIRM|nr:MFS transporter [Anaerosphaera aminiphila]SHH00378.1 Predicted arabinose efflux permease, MFS family [Anaerosphaera aminiphila DSM 21120]